MPGNSTPKLRAMALSSGTSRRSPMAMKRGSASLGTFTRAKTSSPDSGSRITTAWLSDRFEM